MSSIRKIIIPILYSIVVFVVATGAALAQTRVMQSSSDYYTVNMNGNPQGQITCTTITGTGSTQTINFTNPCRKVSIKALSSNGSGTTVLVNWNAVSPCTAANSITLGPGESATLIAPPFASVTVKTTDSSTLFSLQGD